MVYFRRRKEVFDAVTRNCFEYFTQSSGAIISIQYLDVAANVALMIYNPAPDGSPLLRDRARKIILILNWRQLIKPWFYVMGNIG